MLTMPNESAVHLSAVAVAASIWVSCLASAVVAVAVAVAVAGYLHQRTERHYGMQSRSE
jgi:hypothetical protein